MWFLFGRRVTVRGAVGTGGGDRLVLVDQHGTRYRLTSARWYGDLAEHVGQEVLVHGRLRGRRGRRVIRVESFETGGWSWGSDRTPSNREDAWRWSERPARQRQTGARRHDLAQARE